MARDKFFADVRRAVSFMAPRVEADSPFTDVAYIERMLRKADLWISPKVVENFAEADFADLKDEGVRAALVGAVEEFRRVAAAVDGDRAASPEQHDAAARPFTRIVSIVQKLVKEDWLEASQHLLAEAEGWARQAGWPTRRFSRAVTEDFIGKYESERLIYSTDEGGQLALIPLGRFAPGTDGMFDLAVMPAYDSMMVVRERGRWFIHPLPEEEGGTRQDWSRETFASRSYDLVRLP